ncbi:ABC transporter permease [Corynebacterium kroppenstedtii]|uniref:ABC transporter permease n=1 Tax=Corynebacterium sp. PCR 32 TaxID=3351342 RepID=UPI0030983C99
MSAENSHRRSMSSSTAILSVWSRDCKRVIRNKAVLPSIFVIPAIFVAIFYGAFSRATENYGITYPTFLLPAGILQGLIFTAGGSALAVAQDAEDGIHARIRTMPAPDWSLVGGRLLADLTRAAISIVPVILLTTLLGARFRGGAVDLLLLVLLTVGMALAISAMCDGLCLLAQHPVSTSLMFQGLTIPIVMLSTAFVPADALPDGVRPVIRHLPLSTMIDTARFLLDGQSPGSTGIEALCWIVVFLVAGIVGFLAAISRKSHV